MRQRSFFGMFCVTSIRVSGRFEELAFAFVTSAALIVLPTKTSAETFRCMLTHVVRTPDYKGLVESDRKANKDFEFFVEIHSNGQGTENSCTKAGCADQEPVVVIKRDDENDPNRLKIEIRFLVNRYEPYSPPIAECYGWPIQKTQFIAEQKQAAQCVC